MAKKSGTSVGRMSMMKVGRAMSAVIDAKKTATGMMWTILHRVESELARAMKKRSKITHAKTKKGKK